MFKKLTLLLLVTLLAACEQSPTGTAPEVTQTSSTCTSSCGRVAGRGIHR